MATSPALLADEVATALGNPGNITSQVLGWATGLLEELTQNGSATFGGFAGPHPISGMSGSSMATKIANYAGYPGANSTLIAYCNGIVSHIQGSGTVTYTSPTGLPPNWFLGGTISGLSGSAMAAEVASSVGYPGVSPELLAKCTAIADHITGNAEVVSGVIS